MSVQIDLKRATLPILRAAAMALARDIDLGEEDKRPALEEVIKTVGAYRHPTQKGRKLRH